MDNVGNYMNYNNNLNFDNDDNSEDESIGEYIDKYGLNKKYHDEDTFDEDSCDDNSLV